MKKLPITFVILLLLTQLSAQSLPEDSVRQGQKLDSALAIVALHRGDTSEINTLVWLARNSEGKNPERAYQYIHTALDLSTRLKLKNSIVYCYNELGALHHNNGQYDSSSFYYHKVLASGNANAKQQSIAYQGLSVSLLWLAKYDSAKYYLRQAELIAKKNNDYEDLTGIYNSLGNIFLQEDNNEQALKQYILAAKIQDSLLHDPVAQSRALVNIGNVQYRIGDYEKALDYVRQAQKISEAHNLQKHLAYIAQLMGRIYRKQKKLDEALQQYKQALETYLQLGYVREASETHSNIGNIYFDKGDFNQAQEQYKKAIHIAKKSENHHLLGGVYAAMGFAHFQLRQYKLAVIYLDSAMRIAKKINDPYTILDSYEVLSDIYAEQQNFKEALFYHQAFAALKDSLSEASNIEAIHELEVKYQNEKKVGEIELLKASQRVQDLTLSRQRLIITATIILLVLLIVIAFLVVNRFRVMSRTQRLLEIEKVRNNLARDLHDDIGSTLSSINILSQVALNEKNGNVQNYLQRIGEQSARIMEDIGDMVWSVNPHNDSVKQLVMHMREFMAEILESKNINYQFNDLTTETLRLTPEQRKNLFLIFKESINNAAKYSEAKQIDITLAQTHHQLTMKITDNGKGFEVGGVRPGNGLRNQKERAAAINAQFMLTSSNGKGTSVELQLDITS